MKFYTGTTEECLLSMLREGFISINPPKRVWKEYSSSYVYLIPANEEEAFDYAAEQSSFAIYELSHSKRVILEIEGIEEDFLEKDPDSECINGVRYSKNIPISLITNIYIEENGDLEGIQELVAITHFNQHKTYNYRWVENLYYFEGLSSDEIYENIHIKHIDKVEFGSLLYEDEFCARYDDLLSEIERGHDFTCYTVKDYSTDNLIELSNAG